MGQRKKKNKKNKILIKILLLVSPFLLIMSLLLLFMSSVGMFFGNGSLSDSLTTTENSNLVDRVKNGINNKSKELKDYYNTDKRFILEYQYALAYTKYLTSTKDNHDNYLKYFEDTVDSTVEMLWPNFEYKKEKITTVRKYKVKKKQKDTNTTEINSNKDNDSEEEKTETNEEDIYILTRVKSIKSSYEITYETKTETKENNDEKITITKPVISGMKQTDKTWDVLKSIIKKTNSEEDVSNALEVILASSAAYINENVTEKMMDNMIFTGASSGGSVNGVKFTGSQSEFIQKVSIGAIEAYKKYNILPSITIAQAILESGWGKSGLTNVSNNLFGIKAYGWSGAIVDMLTREVAADGSEYYITASFRAYPTWEESIDDHSKVLMQSNFTAVRNATDYKEAAYALLAGEYATEPTYPELIMSVIEDYRLYEYDVKN